MTRKRRSVIAGQLGFSFRPPSPARGTAALAGLARIFAAAVAQALKDDPRSRAVIAAEMTDMLDDVVTPAMLDAYASEAREGHRISADRWLALVAVTDRLDLYDMVSRRIGASVLVGDELEAAQLGHIDSRIRQLQDQAREIRARRPMIDRGTGA